MESRRLRIEDGEILNLIQQGWEVMGPLSYEGQDVYQYLVRKKSVENLLQRILSFKPNDLNGISIMFENLQDYMVECLSRQMSDPSFLASLGPSLQGVDSGVQGSLQGSISGQEGSLPGPTSVPSIPLTGPTQTGLTGPTQTGLTGPTQSIVAPAPSNTKTQQVSLVMSRLLSAFPLSIRMPDPSELTSYYAPKFVLMAITSIILFCLSVAGSIGAISSAPFLLIIQRLMTYVQAYNYVQTLQDKSYAKWSQECTERIETNFLVNKIAARRAPEMIKKEVLNVFLQIAGRNEKLKEQLYALFPE